MRLEKLLIVATVLVLHAPDVWASGPRISFDSEVKDFGKVSYGQKLTQRFPFTNVGDELLIVKDIRADCGCTRTLAGSRELAPGTRSEIVATLETSGPGPGRKEKHIYVRSNDPQRPSVKLTLLADVVRELQVTPSILAMKAAAYTRSLSADLKITNTSDKPVMITGVKALGRNVQAEMEREGLVVGPGCTTPCHIVVSLVQVNRRPVTAGVLVLETDHAREKDLKVPFLIRLAKPSSAEP